MGPRGDLRHDAAIGLVRLRLPDHRLRENLPVARHQRGRAVVARRFKAEDYVISHFLSGPLPEGARNALGVRRCRDFASGLADRRSRWRRRARSPRRSRRRSAGPTAGSQIVEITTTGDKVKDRPLAEIGGKGLWTKELDRALIEDEVDFCVHSMKDVESVRPNNIHIAAVRPRGDVRDRLIGASSIDELKQGAVVGTSSPRRKAQLLRLRPDLKIVTLRGNVDTRLKAVESGKVDATLLSCAGLKRLDIDAGTAIPTEVILPAPGQAVIGIECRTNDTRTQSVLSTVNNQITYDCVMAERAFTRALGATCASPVAAFCVLEDGDLRMRGQLFSEDGADMVEDRAVFDCGEQKTPAELARSLLGKAPESIRRLFSPE